MFEVYINVVILRKGVIWDPAFFVVETGMKMLLLKLTGSGWITYPMRKILRITGWSIACFTSVILTDYIFAILYSGLSIKKYSEFSIKTVYPHFAVRTMNF